MKPTVASSPVVYVALFCFVVVLCGGCGCTNRKEITNLSIVIRNTGSKEIDMASVLMGEYRMRAGILPPGIRKGQVAFNHPITAQVTVSYELPDGELVTKTIPFASRVPEDASGAIDVFFNVNSDTGDVDVRFFAIRRVDGSVEAVPIDGGPDDY